MKILKFGGSSLATTDCIRNVARIVLEEARRGPVIVVLSAFQGVTNQLLDCARLAEKNDRRYDAAWKKIAGRHHSAVDSLLDRRRAIRIRSQVDTLLGDLHDALHGVQLLGHSPPRALDLIASFGERLCALIVAAHLARVYPARFVDARQLVVTDNQFTNANVIFSKTNRAARRYFTDLFQLRRRRPIPVVTGFIGSTSDGQTTTIGRNGSDYTAAILGAALGASVIEIWTDVDGVLSADPKAVAPAFVLPRITYEEAMELSYFGATVLHPAAIAPAVARRIPLLIKNTFHPEAPGTLISGDRSDGDQLAKGISSIAGLTLLTIRGLRWSEFPESPSDYFVRWHLAASTSSSSPKPHPSTRFVSPSARPTRL
jgi:aspartokinase/homoserine dehydrogenase 1